MPQHCTHIVHKLYTNHGKHIHRCTTISRVHIHVYHELLTVCICHKVIGYSSNRTLESKHFRIGTLQYSKSPYGRFDG